MLTFLCISSHKQDNYPKGYSTKLYTVRLSPECQPLSFYLPLWTEKVPLCVPPIDKCMCYLFHIPSYGLCRCTVFKIWINRNTRTLFRLFHSHKMHLMTLLGLITAWNDRFPYRSYTSNGEIPALSYSFLQSLSVYGGGSRGWWGGGPSLYF